jgi:hypothetical protein
MIAVREIQRKRLKLESLGEVIRIRVYSEVSFDCFLSVDTNLFCIQLITFETPTPGLSIDSRRAIHVTRRSTSIKEFCLHQSTVQPQSQPGELLPAGAFLT